MVKIQSRQSALRQASRRRQMLILGTFLVASMVYLLTRSTPSDAEIHEKNLLQVKAPKKPKPPNAIDNLVGKVSCGGHHAASCAACSNPEKVSDTTATASVFAIIFDQQALPRKLDTKGGLFPFYTTYSIIENFFSLFVFLMNLFFSLDRSFLTLFFVFAGSRMVQR